MGVIDMAKMVRKAQQTKNKMKQITAAGLSKSGLTAILLNGLNDVEEVKFEDELFVNPQPEQVAKEVKEAFADAKKQLEQQLASSMDLDSLRDMLAA